MNQSELNALLGKNVLIRGGEHFCCARWKRQAAASAMRGEGRAAFQKR